MLLSTFQNCAGRESDDLEYKLGEAALMEAEFCKYLGAFIAKYCD